MSCRGAVRAAVTTVTSPFFEFGPKYNVGPSIDADRQPSCNYMSGPNDQDLPGDGSPGPPQQHAILQIIRKNRSAEFYEQTMEELIQCVDKSIQEQMRSFAGLLRTRKNRSAYQICVVLQDHVRNLGSLSIADQKIRWQVYNTEVAAQKQTVMPRALPPPMTTAQMEEKQEANRVLDQRRDRYDKFTRNYLSTMPDCEKNKLLHLPRKTGPQHPAVKALDDALLNGFFELYPEYKTTEDALVAFRRWRTSSNLSTIRLVTNCAQGRESELDYLATAATHVLDRSRLGLQGGQPEAWGDNPSECSADIVQQARESGSTAVSVASSLAESTPVRRPSPTAAHGDDAIAEHGDNYDDSGDEAGQVDGSHHSFVNHRAPSQLREPSPSQCHAFLTCTNAFTCTSELSKRALLDRLRPISTRALDVLYWLDETLPRLWFMIIVTFSESTDIKALMSGLSSEYIEEKKVETQHVSRNILHHMVAKRFV